MAETRGQIIGGVTVGLAAGVALVGLAFIGRRAVGLDAIKIRRKAPKPKKTGKVQLWMEYNHETEPAYADAAEWLKEEGYLDQEDFGEILKALKQALLVAMDDPDYYDVKIEPVPKYLIGEERGLKGRAYYEQKAAGLTWSQILNKIPAAHRPKGTSTLQKGARDWSENHPEEARSMLRKYGKAAEGALWPIPGE